MLPFLFSLSISNSRYSVEELARLQFPDSFISSISVYACLVTKNRQLKLTGGTAIKENIFCDRKSVAVVAVVNRHTG